MSGIDISYAFKKQGKGEREAGIITLNKWSED